MNVTAPTTRWLAGGVETAESRLSDFKERPPRIFRSFVKSERSRNRFGIQKKNFSESLKPCALEYRI